MFNPAFEFVYIWPKFGLKQLSIFYSVLMWTVCVRDKEQVLPFLQCRDAVMDIWHISRSCRTVILFLPPGPTPRPGNKQKITERKRERETVVPVSPPSLTGWNVCFIWKSLNSRQSVCVIGQSVCVIGHPSFSSSSALLSLTRTNTLFTVSLLQSKQNVFFSPNISHIIFAIVMKYDNNSLVLWLVSC